MRLLQRQDDGSLTLTKDLVDNIKPYAILSHTWGEDDEEVVFKDVNENTSQLKDRCRQKPGYRKIDLCAKWAATDNLHYFWVDSCCIDKSSGPELQEAITSMFRWYQDAAKCYVYLSDVPRDGGQRPGTLLRSAWEDAFRKSRWFTRGWTLQELLAPRCVEFFSKYGDKLGSRQDLDQLLQEVTGISIDALQGKSLFTFSTSERMSWARGRITKRQEDKAYSLFGIFDVSTYINYGEREERAMNRLRAEIERRWGNVLKTQGSHFMVPFGRNENFVGREAILEQLLERISPDSKRDDCQRTTVEGLGGIGKTQIALEAAYQVRDSYPDCSVFWVPAIDLTSFENAYREVGKLLQLPGINDDKADVKMLVKTGLSQESAGSWLLIVDNADDKEFVKAVLGNYLPFSRTGSILFTTRDHRATAKLDIAREYVLVIPEMNDAEATDLLQKGLRREQMDDPKSVHDLLDFLTSLPLAIKQASAYMAENRMVTISDYLESCKSSDANLIGMLSEEFEDLHRYRSHAKNQNPVATTWLISFENILQYDPQAADYLKFICFLAEKDVPLSLLPVAPKIEVKKAVSTLQAYAFITKRDASDTFDIHRLVRLVIRNWLRANGQWKRWAAKVVQRLTEAYPFPKHENRGTWMRYLPHGQVVLDFYTFENGDHSLLFNIAASYSLVGKYSEAERLYRETLGLREEVLGREHPSTLTSMNNLAEVLGSQGKYDEVEEMHRKILGLKEDALGREHPDTLTSMNNLANVLSSQGKYEEAEKMHRQTLKLMEEVLGREHPDTLTSINNLAEVLRSQGKYEEAEEMHRQTLGLMEEVLGREHPSTLTDMSNLALVLYSRGKYEEAEKMHRQALGLKEEVLGREHPDTLINMDNLANVLGSQGKYKEAEKMHRQALGLREEVLGREHPSTLIGMNNLANVLSSQGKYEEAEKMYRQTLRLMEEVLGREHPDTLTSINNLAEVLRSQGKYEEAEEMHRQTLGLMEEVLGREHPDTLTVMSNLALVLCSRGKYDAAEKMHRQALGLKEEVLGREHPDTLISINNLANVLGSQGKYKEAEKMYRQTPGLMEEELGREHPDTLTIMSNLAEVLHSRGKYEEAEKMYEQTLGLMEEVLGREHPSTLIGREHPSTLASINNLANVLSSQGKYEEAEKMYRQILGMMEEVLGREHPSTLTSMSNLALVLYSQGKYEEAEKMHRQALGLKEEVLGREHPDTLTSMNNLALVLGKQGKHEEANQILSRKRI
ncbi:kinesin light chain 3 [Xylariaceae sp. FL0255]|nr:kinesin light chain 3 [Xylariaceae sp. FL0255]